MATPIHWSERLPDTDQTIITITDGTITSYAVAANVDAAIADYAGAYGFEAPGDVGCTLRVYGGADAAETGDYDSERTFRLRSDDGQHVRVEG